MKLSAIGLALAATCLVATGSPARAQMEPVPPGIPMPLPAGPMPPQGAMPPGQMPPGAYAQMPGGPAMGGYPGSMSGGYPGMAPVMPYPPPLEGNGCVPCGCCDGEGCGDDCCCDSGFGRHGGCCDECCCQPDGTAHWRARIELMLMGFKLPDQPVILTTTSLGDISGIHSLDFDNELSARLSLEAKLPNGHSLETVFLGFMHWNDSFSVLDPNGGLQSPYQTFLGTGVIPYDGAREHDYAYSSNLLSVECNYWAPAIQHSCLQASFAAGARFLRVDEDFVYNALSVVGGNNVLGSTDIFTENNLAAVQVGMMFWVPLAKCVSVRLDGKAGTGYNFAGQTTSIITANNPAGDTNYREHADSHKGSFLAECSLMFSWQVNCYVAIYGGYQALWLDELVLSPDNFNSTFPTAGFRPVLIEDTADRLYQSVLGGLEITW